MCSYTTRMVPELDTDKKGQRDAGPTERYRADMHNTRHTHTQHNEGERKPTRPTTKKNRKNTTDRQTDIRDDVASAATPARFGFFRRRLFTKDAYTLQTHRQACKQTKRKSGNREKQQLHRQQDCALDTNNARTDTLQQALRTAMTANKQPTNNKEI